jgi:hypothetical protein
MLVAALAALFGATSASAVAPTITSTSASAVTTKTAVLEATINPGGEATTYHFEYGLADCSSSSCASAPVPDGNVGAGSSPVEVFREIGGLAPDTTYHYRVVATNGSGAIAGPDKTITTFSPPILDTSCPNQAFRVGASARLPDCRAYEMVSPVDKGGIGIATLGIEVSKRSAYTQSTPGGGRITYSSARAFADQPTQLWSNQYLATRTAAGWNTHGLNPPRPEGAQTDIFPYPTALGTDKAFKAFSEDLSYAWLEDAAKPKLSPDALENFPSLYRRDNKTETYDALTQVAPTISPGPERLGISFQGMSDDGSHAVFVAESPLTPNAAPSTKKQLYEFSNGELHLVSVLPDGTANTVGAVAGSELGGFTERTDPLDKAVSADGSRIFWTSQTHPFDGTVYLRENPDQAQSALDGGDNCTEPAKACTIPISTLVTPGGALFWTASTDGAEVLISAGTPSRPLYTIDVETETPTLVAGEVKGVLGASDDLSYIYFISEEELAPGGVAGAENLYLSHNGAKTFIANVDNNTPPTANRDVDIGDPNPQRHWSRVTPDGRHIAFMSSQSLTGYDNTDAANGFPDFEVFTYDADSEQLTCASCNPSGARPLGKPLQEPISLGNHPISLAPIEGGGNAWAAAWLPTAEDPFHTPRALSDDGNRVFFNSFDALVAQDTNGQQDVYQWEAQGTGGCQRVGGCIDLISTGESPEKSEFVDASANGGTVFFETSSSIDPADPGLIDIYAARAGGGFQPPPAAPTPCFGDACQSVPAAPNDPTPASAGFRGQGDPAPRKPRRKNCRARNRKADKGAKQGKRKRGAKQGKRKKGAKRCSRGKRRAVR